MWGWIIPIGLIILGLILSGNASEVITVFSDNSTSTRKEDNGGCFFALVGLVWLGIKIYNLFDDSMGNPTAVIDWILTTECNMTCPYCLMGKHKKSTEVSAVDLRFIETISGTNIFYSI